MELLDERAKLVISSDLGMTKQLSFVSECVRLNAWIGLNEILHTHVFGAKSRSSSLVGKNT